MKLQEIPFAEVARIYQEQAKAKLPLTDKEFREVISAEYMVFGRKGLGGPQVDEVKSFLSDEIGKSTAQSAWLNVQTKKLIRSRLTIEKDFGSIGA